MSKQRAVCLILGGVVVVAAVQACHSAEERGESLCAWAADADNCARRFHEEMASSDETCAPRGQPTPVDPSNPSSPNGVPNGAFLSLHALDVCYLAGGGRIAFDPPIELGKYPLSAGTPPIAYTLSIDRPNGTRCGSIVYTTERDFSLTMGGTYTQRDRPADQALDITCPGGGVHHLDASETGTCPQSAELLPRASLVVNPGSVDVPPAVSLTISWPEVVTYFNCTVPTGGACLNGVLDGGETDVDCGGPEVTAGCPARCGEGQRCVSDCDCAASLACGVLAGETVCQAAPGFTPSCGPPDPCTNNVKDGDETDIDCGGSCVPCSGCQSCVSDNDCASGNCVGSCCQ